MKTKKPGRTGVLHDYTAPCIIALSIFGSAPTLRASVCKKYWCAAGTEAHYGPVHTNDGTYTGFIPARNALLDTYPGTTLTLVCPKPYQGPHTLRPPTNGKVTITMPVTYILLASPKYNTIFRCVFNINQASPIHANATPSHRGGGTSAERGAALHNTLLKLSSSSTATARNLSRSMNTPQYTLAEVTLALVLKALNKTPGGIQLKRGALIDPATLTAEQQSVLQDHMGLMRSVLRQLKTELKNVPARIEPSTDGNGRENNRGATDAPS